MAEALLAQAQQLINRLSLVDQAGLMACCTQANDPQQLRRQAGGYLGCGGAA